VPTGHLPFEQTVLMFEFTALHAVKSADLLDAVPLVEKQWSHAELNSVHQS
jgi:hypothetical protein